MAKIVVPIDRFSGISYSEKEGPTSSYLFGRSVDYRTDHKKLTLLPRTIKESGTVVTDLPMVADQQGSDAYIYGDVGNIYKRTSGRTYSLEHTASNSTGNGIKYYGEDSYLYYTQDTTIGRCGPFWGTSTWVDGFLEAQGGIPLNTACMDFEASSSQYATAADSASLSITGDISIEAYVKAESLPSAGSTRMIVSKWDENSDERSYYLGISAVSGYFGDGGDGALTVSVNTTQAPTDSACTGAATSYSLSATNASFAATKKILIHQTRGTGAGKWERNEITSYTAGTITTVDPLKNTYTSGAQIIQLPEYTNVTVNTGITWTAKAWNGTVGGILAFLANGTITVTGAIIATGKGFRKGAGGSVQHDPGEQAEGTSGAGGTNSKYANGNGGGGGDEIHDNWEGGGGGGGGHTNAGSWGLDNGGDEKGRGGGSVGSADLTTLVFGGGGGGGAASHQEAAAGGDGGNGGGIVFMVGTTITITGSVVSGGSNGSNGAGTAGAAGGGGGAGGSILLKAQTATLGATKITASAGSGGIGTSGITRCDGGAGSVGRIHLDYYSSYSGTTTPTLDVIQDNNLVTNTTYRVVLGLSDDGSTVETLVMNLDSMNTDTWYRFQVAWDASASTAYFYRNGSSLGTSTGAMTAIYDSTALLGLAASFDSSSDDENHWDGKIDDVRIFNDVRTAGEFLTYKNVEIGEVQGLQAYYQLDSTETDSSANSNTLTLENAPTYDTTDVPFASPTTRAELDQSLDTSGNTYTLTTAINEGATHRQSFVPAKDPQKSIEVLVAAAGTGDWTITVHDAQNREIATLDVDNAELAAGDYEFIFASAWRPVVGATYHFHLTSTVADGTVTTTDAADLETVDFHTYYQVLVDDPYHPIEQVTNILAIGNERYLATWDGVTYNPHRLVFPSGYRVRCLGIWREYLVIGTSRGTNIDDFDQGRLFFWDGVSDTYNFSSPVPQGGVNAIMSGDPMYFAAGYSGDLMKYEGGKPKKVLRFPKMTRATTMEVLPGGMTMYRALCHVAVAGSTDSTTLEQGVYSWGNYDERQEESLSFDYPTSTGQTTGSGLKISMLFSIGTELLIGWQYGSSYGVDYVAPTNPPFATGRYESLITDVNKIWHDKMGMELVTYFKSLSSGDSIQQEYKIDRNNNWTEGTAQTTARVKIDRVSLPSTRNRFYEIQSAIDISTSNSTSPEVYGLAISIEDLTQERRV